MLEDAMKRDLLKILNDDINGGDITSALTPQHKARGLIKCGEDSVTVSGVEEAVYLFEQAGVIARPKVEDGQRVKKGELIIDVVGLNRVMLAVERTALNVLGRMSGVASRCRRAVSLAETEDVQLMLTRKTSPGFNLFDKKACTHGGVLPHRRNLGDMVLLKDIHLVFFDSVREAVEKACKAYPKKIVEVEAENAKQALEAALAGADMIMLDNFPKEHLAEVIRNIRRNSGAKIELSGGIAINDLGEFVAFKPDFISLGTLTKEAKMVDFSMDFEQLD